METTNFVTKKSLTGTLANMSVKEVIEINIKDFKEYSIRNAAIKLKKKGYLFSVSSAGRIDSNEIKIGKIDSGRKTELHRQLPPLS